MRWGSEWSPAGRCVSRGQEDDRPLKRVALLDTNEVVARRMLSFVDDRYHFEYVPPGKADYIIHSVDGFDVLKYDAVRIFVTGENVPPNFLISDYAAAFDKLEYRDRYIWMPLIRLYPEAYDVLLRPRRPAEEIASEKDSFCSYVMSNTKNSARERIAIFDKLSTYDMVSSGGRWRNNVGGRVADKDAFQRRHKFAIAFENHSYPGYLTEKFSQAAAVDAIPIYWGDPDIAEVFNSKAFVNCHDFNSLDEVVGGVVEIDQDRDRYLAMLAEPWFRNGAEYPALQRSVFIDFLTNIFDQPLPLAYRRNRGRWGLKKEAELRNMAIYPCRYKLRQMRTNFRSLRHKLLGTKKRR